MASFTERYHESTKYNPFSIDRLGQAEWAKQPLPFRGLDETQAIGLCSYLPFMGKTLARAADELGGVPGPADFTSMHSLAWLLQFSAGITGVAQTEGGPVYFRANPSAGGLYPVELFFAIRDWEGLADGIYLFHPLICAAVPVVRGNPWPDLMAAFSARKVVEASRLILLFGADLRRSEWRYRERSYRRVLLDAGCAVSNAVHHAAIQGVRTRLLGGFRDQMVQDLLKLDGDNEFPLVGLALGVDLPDPSPELHHPPSLPPHLAAAQLGTVKSLQRAQRKVESIPEAFLPLGEAPAPIVWTDDPIILQSCGLGPKETDDTQLLRALGRRSCRRYAPSGIELSHLGALLDLSYRPFRRDHLSGSHLKHWVIVHQVDGLKPGVYRYDPQGHALHLHFAKDLHPALHEIGLGQELGRDCAAVLMHTANLDQATRQYGDRAYRYLKIDSGLLGEGINLHCALFQCGSSGLGGYFDDLCNETLELPASEAILYLITVGIPAVSGPG